MGGRLLDWLGQGVAASRPAAIDMDALTDAQGAALYYANDTQILSIYDSVVVDWFEIDVIALSSVSFETLPDVDWSTPPTDEQVFIWDTASSKLMPADFPSLDTEDVQDIVGAMFINGTGLTASYNDATGMVELNVTITQYTDEMAMDAIAVAFAAGTHIGIDLVYDDGLNFYSLELDVAYVNGLIATAIAAASVDDLVDVDITTTPPTDGQALVWSGADSAFVPGDAGGVVSDTILYRATTPTSNVLEVTGLVLDDFDELIINGFGLESDAAFNVQVQFYIDGVLSDTAGDYSVGSYSAATSESNSAYGTETATSILVFDTTSNNYQPSATAVAGFQMKVVNPTSTQYKSGNFHAQHNDGASGVGSHVSGGFMVIETGKITGVRVTSSNGTLDVGGLSVRAIRKAVSTPVTFSGSAFPSSPSVGQRFFRTDRGIEYYWDGIRWLSTQLFVQTVKSSEGAGADGIIDRSVVPFKGVYDIWVESLQVTRIKAAAATWLYELIYTSAANVDTTWLSVDTSADAAGTWVDSELAVAALIPAAAMSLKWFVNEVTGATLFYAAGMLKYRLVG